MRTALTSGLASARGYDKTRMSLLLEHRELMIPQRVFFQKGHFDSSWSARTENCYNIGICTGVR